MACFLTGCSDSVPGLCCARWLDTGEGKKVRRGRQGTVVRKPSGWALEKLVMPSIIWAYATVWQSQSHALCSRLAICHSRKMIHVSVTYESICMCSLYEHWYFWDFFFCLFQLISHHNNLFKQGIVKYSNKLQDVFFIIDSHNTSLSWILCTYWKLKLKWH